MNSSRHRSAAWGVALMMFAAVALSGTARGMQLARRVARPGGGGGAAAGGMVNLPYMVNDNRGNNWRIYQGGWMQQQGNQPLYSQACQLTINGNSPNMNNNQARLDDKTGEVVFENMNANGIMVTRRVLVDREQGTVRYIEVIKNSGAQAAQVQIQISSNFNYGIQATQTVPDPRRKGQDLALVAQTGAGPSVMEVFAGKGAKQPFRIVGQPQNNVIQASINPTIPAGKEIALVHLHGIVPNNEAGVTYVRDLKESQLLRSIPREIRRLVVNFATGQNFIGDVEILRGDLLDVVELKGGDQFRGTLRETSFALETFYGKVELPVAQVIGVINVGRFRPRQLVVTSDGQIFGGRLAKETVDLELSSKQVTKIPLAQVSRIGYRKREGEPEEWTFEKPIVLMRTGERVGVRMPTEPVTVLTRYGKLSLNPQSIASVLLQAEEHGVHEVRLTDGSRFAGLLDATSFPMTLDSGGGGTAAVDPDAGPEADPKPDRKGNPNADPKGDPDGVAPKGRGDDAPPVPANGAGTGVLQKVTFPASAVSRVQFNGKVVEPDDAAPTLALANEDVLVGTLSGKLAIDTAFDTIDVSADEIRSLTHPTPGSLDVSLTLWDGTTLSGQLQDQELSCKLLSGVTMRVPVALLQEYQQPRPVASGQMVDRIKALVADLNAEDWKQRDRAEATLTGMGAVAIGVLREIRGDQPPEAQQRIDSILTALDKQEGGGGEQKPKPAPPAGNVEGELEIEIDG